MSKGKELREEISTQSSRIQSINNTYRAKLYSLDTRISNLSQKVRNTSRGILQKTREKHIKYTEELEQLTLEREQLKTSYRKVIEVEKKKLRDLREEYKNNRTVFKEEDKKERQEKIGDFKDTLYFKKENFINKIKDNKLLAIAAALFLIFMTGIIVYSINAENTEKNRDYYINIDDSYEFDCNINASKSDELLYCENRTVSGVFSSYETVKFDEDYNYNISGDRFTKTIEYSVPTSYYQIDNFNEESIEPYFEEVNNIVLTNTVLHKNVVEKQIKIKYNLSDEDKDLIIKRHNEWVVKKTEEAKKQSEEAERAKREEETRKQEEEARKIAEEESKKSYRYITIKDGESCPSNTQVCLISDGGSGYAEYGYGMARGRIINNTKDDFSYIQVSMSVYNASGVKIGDCLANSSGLKAGTTWAYEAYCTGWDRGSNLKDLDISWW